MNLKVTKSLVLIALLAFTTTACGGYMKRRLCRAKANAAQKSGGSYYSSYNSCYYGTATSLTK